MLVCNKVRNWKLVCKTHHSFQKSCQFYTLKWTLIGRKKTLIRPTETPRVTVLMQIISAPWERTIWVSSYESCQILINLFTNMRPGSHEVADHKPNKIFFFWFMSWQILDLMILNLKNNDFNLSMRVRKIDYSELISGWEGSRTLIAALFL